MKPALVALTALLLAPLAAPMEVQGLGTVTPKSFKH